MEKRWRACDKKNSFPSLFQCEHTYIVTVFVIIDTSIPPTHFLRSLHFCMGRSIHMQCVYAQSSSVCGVEYFILLFVFPTRGIYYILKKAKHT